MKRNTLTKIVVLLMTLVLALTTFVGCDQTDSAVSAFEDAGYKVEKKDEAYKNDLIALLASYEEKAEFLKACEIFEIQVPVEKDTEDSTVETEKEDYETVSLMISFASEEDVEKFLTTKKEDGSSDTTALDKARENNLIRENCLLILGDDGTEGEKVTAIFEKYTTFKPMNFLQNAKYMGIGMLGIFVVIGLIVITTYILNKATNLKK